MIPRLQFVTIEGRQEGVELRVVEDEDDDYDDVCLLADTRTIPVSQVSELRALTMDGKWTVFHKGARNSGTTWFGANGVQLAFGLTTYECNEQGIDEHKILIVVGACGLRGTFYEPAAWDAYCARRRQHLYGQTDNTDTTHFPYPWRVDGIEGGAGFARVFDALAVAMTRQ